MTAVTATEPPSRERGTTSIVCWRCSSSAQFDYDQRPKCGACDVWLVHCDLTGQWVSITERTKRQLSFAAALRVLGTRHLAEIGADIGQPFLPDGWTLRATQRVAQAPFALVLRPPNRSEDGLSPVSAELHPRIPDGWGVDVIDRRRKARLSLGFGAAQTTIAPFPGLHEALTAAIAAVRHA